MTEKICPIIFVGVSAVAAAERRAVTWTLENSACLGIACVWHKNGCPAFPKTPLESDEAWTAEDEKRLRGEEE